MLLQLTICFICYNFSFHCRDHFFFYLEAPFLTRACQTSFYICHHFQWKGDQNCLLWWRITSLAQDKSSRPPAAEVNDYGDCCMLVNYIWVISPCHQFYNVLFICASCLGDSWLVCWTAFIQILVRIECQPEVIIALVANVLVSPVLLLQPQSPISYWNLVRITFLST